MKKSLIISIVLIIALATVAILIVPRLGESSGVKVSADTVEKSDGTVQIEENDPASLEDAAPAVEEEPDTTPLYEATKTVLVSEDGGFKVVIDGEEITLTPDGTDVREGVECGIYLAEDGSKYVFAPDGEFMSVMHSLEEQMDACSLYMEGGLEAVSEDEAVAVAEETFFSLFGSKIERAELTGAYFDETGIYSIYFNEMVGKDKNIRGLEYYAMVLPDGKVFSAGTNLSILLRDVRVCDLDKFTAEYIENDFRDKINEYYGDDLISYSIEEITFKNVNKKTQLFVIADPEIKNRENYNSPWFSVYYDIPGVSD